MRRVIFVSVALLTVTACGLTAPDDAPFLAQLGFDKPVTFQWSVPASGNFTLDRRDNATALAGLLVKAGGLTIQPDQNAPWWHFATTDGQDPQGLVTFTIGSRQIDSRSEVKQWQEGSIDNFAETVTYHIQLADGLQKAGIAYGQSFTARVLASNNPSVGHWALSPDQSQLVDADIVRTALTETGRTHVDELIDAINRAKTIAFDGIEKDLKAAGIMARTDQDSHVLISKRANVYIYSGKIPITGRNFTQLEEICNALRTKVGGPWHAPTYQDLLNTLANQSNPSFLTLNDTPDHRLFGEIIGTNTGFVTFQSKDLHPVGPSNTWMVLNFNTNGYFTSDMHYDLSYTLSDTDRLLCLSTIGK